MKKRLLPFILLITALFTGGTLMMLEGKDAVTMASVTKNSLLTADTLNLSFQGVGGKVIAIQVIEEQQVKQGDVLMTLEPTDLELQIAKLKTDIQQQDVKLQQVKAQGDRGEDVERQILAVEAVKQALDLAQINYDRTKALFEAEAVAQASLDTVTFQLENAKNALSQQQAALKKLKTDIQNNDYNVELAEKQKESMMVQLEALEVQKDRMVLKAPADGKVSRIVPKIGENIAPGVIAIVIESNQLYYDIYVNETQINKYKPGSMVSGYVVALKRNVEGKVRYITSAPQYANMRMSREKGQADVSSFLIRIDIENTPELIPGMTVEVNSGENTH
ncbi:HlyD family secretion protein [Desulforamulus aquiferis]|uniref:HlyD family efflux transporter periplasmic adaptor subunit n=1 Tax=Desulforamulus aquiferis TaxID=1397668 RepID=A0AAW7Z9E2_9FIRM|nr:HlyD family efflux transporter periplasmic adaptor subunit [Desulforamulus aquiferis]MDO7785908.1 HlyD family efflux transporter periplasmic adaptor subunit [Desulforamulus aquiferis]